MISHRFLISSLTLSETNFWLRLGAQGVTLSVCLSGTKCSVFLFLALIFKQTSDEHSESILRAFREHSESTQRAREQSDFVIPSEPKILRLVFSFSPSIFIIYRIIQYFHIFNQNFRLEICELSTNLGVKMNKFGFTPKLFSDGAFLHTGR